MATPLSAMGYLRMPFNQFPDTNRPMVSAVTQWPGATADEVALELTHPVEVRLSALDGVRRVTSISRDQASLVQVEFEYGNDIDLAVHPVTNAELAGFLEAGGYREDAFWPGRALAWRNGQIGQEATQKQAREDRREVLDALGAEASAEAIRDRFKLSLAAAKWWQERISSSDEAFEAWLVQAYPPPSGPFTKPRYWRSLTWGNPAQPVVGVCWYEARAYCLWLNAVLATDRYRLPCEAEWEAAGRGRGEWRRYAWLGDFDPLRANTAETRLGVTTPVGVFPEGATPETGLLDLCGNVLEWTATAWSEGETWRPPAAQRKARPRRGVWRAAAPGTVLGTVRVCGFVLQGACRPWRNALTSIRPQPALPVRSLVGLRRSTGPSVPPRPTFEPDC